MMRTSVLIGLLFLLTACAPAETNAEEETDSKEETNQTEEAKETDDKEEQTEDDNNESESDSNSEDDIEISLESVLEEEEGTMLDASEKELEEELTNFIEENDGDVTDEEVYEKLLEMLGGHPDVKEGIEYFQDFSPELVDLTDKPGGLKVEDGELSLKNNVYILMDNSESMSEDIDGQTKMDAARESINQFVEDMPKGTEVSLISYGFNKESDEKDNEDDSEEKSCSAVEETFALGEYEADDFNEALNKYDSEGFTPLALAIEEVGKVIEESDSTGSHTIYVVSDGKETCHGDPVEAVEALPEDENVETVLNIIGFDISDDEVQSLVDITEANGGEYLSATNPDELSHVLKQEKLALFTKYRAWSNENLKNITEASNDKQIENTQLVNAANTANRQTDNRIVGVLNDVSLNSSQEFRYPQAKEWANERYLIVRDYLSENYDEADDATLEEKEKLRDSVNEQFDEIESKYKKDVEESEE